MSLESINPASGDPIKSFDEMSEREVNDVLKRCDATFREKWSQASFAERGECFKDAAAILRKNKREYAKLMAVEMGKPVTQGMGEIEKCAWGCEYYADHAEALLQPQFIHSDASKSYVTYQPLGVIFIIMPWNFPFWQVFRCAAPAMMAGNTIVLKHANNVTGCALAIEKIFQDAGFPENAFRTLLVSVPAVEGIISNDYVRGVSLTGSTKAGRAVGKQAGEALKPVVLELGGSDPFLVLDDADLDYAAEQGAKSRLQANGQSCIAAKRFIVSEKIHDDFVKRMQKEMESAKMGDPLDEDTALGPLVRVDARDSLHEQVTKSVKKGAKVICGGEIPDGKGAYYPATILDNVAPGMPAYDEEMFGPVAAILTAKNEDDAIRLANDTEYGLGANVFSRDVRRAEAIAAERLQAGCCFVNAFVRSDPRLPFGGIKHSGLGRELGPHGILEFVNIKTVYVK